MVRAFLFRERKREGSVACPINEQSWFVEGRDLISLMLLLCDWHDDYDTYFYIVDN
jgi:DNA-binding HxlR family transcriptional regulator